MNIFCKPSLSVSRSPQAGVTLIGVLVAALILVSGALAIVQLVSRTQHTAGLALEKFVATSLARESLELVQNQRDTNWFSHDAATTGDCATAVAPDGRDECWLERLCGEDGRDATADHQIAIDRDPSAGITVIHQPTTKQQRLFIGSNNLWSHVPSTQATAYQRLVSLNCSQAAQIPPVVEVTSQVAWSSRESDHTVVVKERLYNWYKEQ